MGQGGWVDPIPYHVVVHGIDVVAHVALLVVGLQYAGQLAVSSHVEACVGGEHDQPGAAVPPADPLLHNTDNNLFNHQPGPEG